MQVEESGPIYYFEHFPDVDMISLNESKRYSDSELEIMRIDFGRDCSFGSFEEKQSS